MTISRRELLGRLAANAAVGVALQSLGGLPLVEASCMPRKLSPFPLPQNLSPLLVRKCSPKVHKFNRSEFKLQFVPFIY